MNFFTKIKDVLTDTEKFFGKVKKETFTDPFFYSLIFMALASFLIAPYYFYLYGGMVGQSLLMLWFPITILFLIIGIIGLFIGAGLTHLIAWALKGKGNFADTLKGMVYGGTPNYLWGLFYSIILSTFLIFGLINVAEINIMSLFLAVPSIGFWIYSVVLTLKGLSILHKFSKGKAAIAYFGPFAILMIIAIIITIFFLIIIAAIGLGG